MCLSVRYSAIEMTDIFCCDYDDEVCALCNVQLEIPRFIAAANIAFEDRKHFMTSNSQKAVRWIEANGTIFRLAAHLRYSLPWYRYVATPKWKRLAEAEEYLSR